MATHRLARLLLATRGAPPSAEGLDALEAALAGALAAGKRAFPGVEVPERALLAALARHLPKEGLLPALQALHAEDLYLATGCALGLSKALAALEERVLPQVAKTLKRLSAAADLRQDALQRLRAKLLLGKDGHAPGIAEYSGRGPLLSFVRASAVRTALDMRRVERDHLPIEEQLDELPALADPELQAIHRQYRKEFKAALEQAFAALTSQERNVLRLYVLEGLTLDRIAHGYRVHESTVSRWVARSREKLLEQTRRILLETLRVSERELESLMGAARSQLDVSLSGLLARTQG